MLQLQLFLLFWCTICYLCQCEYSKYVVIVDAGSTGSRAFVVNFSVDSNGIKSISTSKAKKLTPGLSSFNKEPQNTVEYMMPVFLRAVELIPPESASTTVAYIRGTAGMRLLEENEQSAIWDALCEGTVSYISLMSTDSLR